MRQSLAGQVWRQGRAGPQKGAQLDGSGGSGPDPQTLPAELARCLHGHARLVPAQPPFTELSGVTGAYALIIRLEGRRRLDITRLGAPNLGPGWYIYVGNAYGPGGLGARLNRHGRADKAAHWHVDQLTALGSIRALAVQPDGDECRIVATLSALGGFTHPVKGFGSSDCRTCRSHLLIWTGGSYSNAEGA